MGDEVDILKLDVDENPELASQLQVRKTLTAQYCVWDFP